MLGDQEKKVLFKSIETKNHDHIFQDINREDSQAKVTDTLMNYIDLKYSQEIMSEKGPMYDWKMKVMEKLITISY